MNEELEILDTDWEIDDEVLYGYLDTLDPVVSTYQSVKNTQ